MFNGDNSYKSFIIAKKKLILVCKYFEIMFTYEDWYHDKIPYNTARA